MEFRSKKSESQVIIRIWDPGKLPKSYEGPSHLIQIKKHRDPVEMRLIYISIYIKMSERC